jgi:HEAT repeat protein
MKAVARSGLILTVFAAVSVVRGQEPPNVCQLCQLRFDLAVERNTYEVGEPIQLSLRLTNLGTAQIQVQHTSDVTGRHDGYRFEVLDEDGRQVADPGGASISLREALGGTVSVVPRGTDNRRFTLNYHVAPLKPGRYSVKGLFRSSYPQPGLDAESNRVVISIQPTSPDKLRQRVSDLTRDLEVDARRGAAFLGFTGDVAAIPPLIDLLYRKDDGVQVAAIDALLYLDRGTVEGALLDALKQQGARERMVHFLVVNIATRDALIRPVLIQGLRSADSDARTGAVEGLRLLNSAHDPELFAPLAAMLGDPVAAVRHKASAAVGGYQNQQALAALTPLVDDTDTLVSEQATIAVGWIAQASAIGSDTRKDAIVVLRKATESPRRPVSEQARKWLSNVGAR